MGELRRWVMRTCLYSLTCYILLISLTPQASQSCTTFCLDKGGQLLFGRNYDWMVDDCLVIVNKRGVKKSALTDYTKDFGQPASWTSKYGSITFNQYGREFPSGGMNEAGLVVESMMLLEVPGFPEADSRPYINLLQWKQYQLDSCSSVEEVIASNAQIKIENFPSINTGLHFLVCDRKGNCAIIEFLEGKMVYYTKETMPVKALTNVTYKELIEFWKEDKLPNTDLGRSVERFATAATMLERYDVKTTKSAVDYAFDILKKVAVVGPMATEWSIVYDIINLRIHFRTLDNQEIRHINLKRFNLSCIEPVKFFDIQADQSGDVTKKFIDYTQEINQTLIGNAFKETVWTWLMPANDNKTIHPYNTPENLVNLISQYPETTICTNK